MTKVVGVVEFSDYLDLQARYDALLEFALMCTRHDCPSCGPMAEGMHHGDDCPLAGRFYKEENDG